MQHSTLLRNTAIPESLVVQLSGSHPADVSVQTEVTIPAGQQQATVPVFAIDNFRAEQDFVANVTGITSNAPQTWLPLAVIDDDPDATLISNLSELDGTNGFRLDGIAANDWAGWSVDSAGDINGDGYDDVIVGTYNADPNGNFSGQVYVVFGMAEGFAAATDLLTLDGTNGFRVDGLSSGDRIGYSVSHGGDVNGDGIDDLIIGAPKLNNTGATYVVFGRLTGFADLLDLSALDGTNGYRIDGAGPGDRVGYSVDIAGDINTDGYDDLIIGAPRVGSDGVITNTGAAYLVLGNAGPPTASINLASLDGTNGFRINEINPDDWAGVNVSSAGDFNGDGYADFVIGEAHSAFRAADNVPGHAYIVFGTSAGFAATLNLGSLDGSNGFRLADGRTGVQFGRFVSDAGDINGDGFDDVIVSAQIANSVSGDNRAGESFVILGRAEPPPAVLDVQTLDGNNGFRIDGVNAGDNAGHSISSAGDVNGDGLDDIIIGARAADANGASNAGESYVVFGGDFSLGSAQQVGDASDNIIIASNGIDADILVGAQGNDTLISDGGPDVLRGGAGDDILAITDVEFSSTRRLSGGTGFDTLRLDGSGLTLDLTAIRDNRIIDIETIDITGNGPNNLTLSVQDVFNISSNSNTLNVRRDVDDTIDTDTGWTQQSDETIGAETFEVFTQGAAILRIVSLTSDLTATSFNAVSDHVPGGTPTATFTVENIGTVSAGPSTAHIIWSANNTLGDTDDVPAGNSAVAIPALAPGESSTQTVQPQLDLAALFAHALASNPVNQPPGSISTETGYLFLVVDVNNAVEEGDETNNSGRGHLIDSDDITYFPWDKNGNEIIEPLEVLDSIRAIGTSNAANDFDGNGIVTPFEALSTLRRIGDRRNETVFESSSKHSSPLSASQQKKEQTAKEDPEVTTAVAPAPAANTASAKTPLRAAFVESDDDRNLFARIDVPAELPVALASETTPAADIDSEFESSVDWLSAI